jgi:hypothetical protein
MLLLLVVVLVVLVVLVVALGIARLSVTCAVQSRS